MVVLYGAVAVLGLASVLCAVCAWGISAGIQ